MNWTPKSYEPVWRHDMPVSVITHAGSDDLIAGAAWVSTSGEEAQKKSSENPEQVDGLINYLMTHRHGSPFEHGFVTFCIRAPIFVWREFHRHRIGFSYNEESARYAVLKPEFYIPAYDRPMIKVPSWKPGRPKFMTLDEAYPNMSMSDKMEIYDRSVKRKQNECILSYEAYLQDLDEDFDPGLSRSVLPVGIYSSCWVSCNPRSIMSFLSLRVHSMEAKFVSYPQWEINKVADQMEYEFAQLWPITYDAFIKRGRVAP